MCVLWKLYTVERATTDDIYRGVKTCASLMTSLLGWISIKRLRENLRLWESRSSCSRSEQLFSFFKMFRKKDDFFKFDLVVWVQRQISIFLVDTIERDNLV